MSEVVLETRKVAKITGKFVIPSYQRGYRWDIEVTRLLDDIYENGSKPYCLQPIVVKQSDDGFIVIDGQQRLTTIYLIYKYFYDVFGGRGASLPNFTLNYKIREASAEYLLNLDFNRRDENIDFYYMANAYDLIDKWFSQCPSDEEKFAAINNIRTYFVQNVSIIWYETDSTEDERALFTRLNIGKIRLTNAELVKAMMLSKSYNPKITDERKNEISIQWDLIERELKNDSLWYFLTNNNGKHYQTRIDLILDLIAEKSNSEKEEYFTFFKFSQRSKNEDITKIWEDILHRFLILKGWYNDRELYHKIGYLIATGDSKYCLSEIFRKSKGIEKSKFNKLLDKLIRESVSLNKKGTSHDEKKHYHELDYTNSTDKRMLQRILLLFNVESVLEIKDKQKFPFDVYKSPDEGVVWSLEHIHAQHSESLKDEKQWRRWLEEHKAAIEILDKGLSEEERHGDILNELTEILQRATIGSTNFKNLQEQIERVLSADGGEGIHHIGNLAILNTKNNAAINNSVFAVKRKHIIELDMKGQFIPPCTKNVFLKYYSMSEGTNLYYWGHNDYVAYIKEINRLLKDKYLEEEISTAAVEEVE
ncbi:MAG: DUF262 domain-containing protein [Clostridiales bacterium]|nr:DUF262 domain-containing protein [Clostridiales bacterium]